MKRTAVLFFVLVMLFSCNSENEKYQEVYESWKTEMSEIGKVHTEALSILDGFEQKIDGHKKRLEEFTSYVDDSVKEISTLKGNNREEEVSGLEKEIIEKANENMKKHTHFSYFLNNLSALQGTFEDKPFELTAIPDENEVTQFNSLNDATDFWVKEKNNINAGHNKALSIIADLENHIHHHQKEIKEFTQKIAGEGKGKKALSELEDNLASNKKKHEHFTGFLKNLKQVQKQFEG